MPTPLSRRDQLIARRYRDDRLSSNTIAAQMGLNVSVVARVVKRLGLTRPFGWHCKPNPRLKSRNDSIERLYRQGLTVQQIIERLDLKLTKCPVLNVLKARGVPRRQAGSWNPNRPPPSHYRTREYAASIAPKIGTGPNTSAAAFARARGIKVQTLIRHLHALGVRPVGGGSQTRLTARQVKRIKNMLVNSKATFAAIADRVGTNPNAINSIAMGQTWKHVPWPGGKPYQRRRPRRLFWKPGQARAKRVKLSRAKRPLRAKTHHLRIGTRVYLNADTTFTGRVEEIRDSDANGRPLAPRFKIKWTTGFATWHKQAELTRHTR